MNREVAIVILARMSSSRLPGKALKDLHGKPVLSHLIDRLLTVVARDQIILATSELPSDDPLEEFARRERIRAYRGSLEGVGERFYKASLLVPSPFACRINGDNLFLDCHLLSTLMDKALSSQVDFLSNVKGRTYPKGMSVEIVRKSYYADKLVQIKGDPYCNEHVMVCLYKDPCPPNHYYHYNKELPEAAGIQLALDTQDDWERSQWMMQHLPKEAFDLKTTLDIYQQYEASLSR